VTELIVAPVKASKLSPFEIWGDQPRLSGSPSIVIDNSLASLLKALIIAALVVS